MSVYTFVCSHMLIYIISIKTIVGQHCPLNTTKAFVEPNGNLSIDRKKKGVVHKYMTTIVKRLDDSLFYTVNAEND